MLFCNFFDILRLFAQGIFRDLLKQIVFYNGGNKRLLLKNPHNTGRIKILKELYPTAKFIFIHRNPYEVFNSTKHLYRTTIKSQFLQDFGEEEINERVLLGYEKTMMAYLEQRHEIGKENLIEISYTELSEQPMNCIENIYKKLEIGQFKEVKNNFETYLDHQKNYKKNAFNPIPNHLKNQINKRWAFAFEAWSYEMN